MKLGFLERYGTWAVVTGASSGIGRETAIELAKLGFNLVIVARDNEQLESLARLLTEHFEVQIVVASADLGTQEGIKSVLKTCFVLDVGLFVASAGFGTSGSFIQADIDTEMDLLQVNSGAVLAMSHHFAGRFAERGRGGIVLFGSIVGFQGLPNAANYAASKAYVQSLAEALHIELRPHGVDVIAAAPGPTRSKFADRANMQMGATVKPDVVARQTLAALGNRMTTRPGWLSKVLGYSLLTAPRALRVRIMGAIMKGMARPAPRTESSPPAPEKQRA